MSSKVARDEDSPQTTPMSKTVAQLCGLKRDVTRAVEEQDARKRGRSLEEEELKEWSQLVVDATDILKSDAGWFQSATVLMMAHFQVMNYLMTEAGLLDPDAAEQLEDNVTRARNILNHAYPGLMQADADDAIREDAKKEAAAWLKDVPLAPKNCAELMAGPPAEYALPLRPLSMGPPPIGEPMIEGSGGEERPVMGTRVSAAERRARARRRFHFNRVLLEGELAPADNVDRVFVLEQLRFFNEEPEMEDVADSFAEVMLTPHAREFLAQYARIMAFRAVDSVTDARTMAYLVGGLVASAFGVGQIFALLAVGRQFHQVADRIVQHRNMARGAYQAGGNWQARYRANPTEAMRQWDQARARGTPGLARGVQDQNRAIDAALENGRSVGAALAIAAPLVMCCKLLWDFFDQYQNDMCQAYVDYFGDNALLTNDEARDQYKYHRIPYTHRLRERIRVARKFGDADDVRLAQIEETLNAQTLAWRQWMVAGPQTDVRAQAAGVGDVLQQLKEAVQDPLEARPFFCTLDRVAEINAFDSAYKQVFEWTQGGTRSPNNKLILQRYGDADPKNAPRGCGPWVSDRPLKIEAFKHGSDVAFFTAAKRALDYLKDHRSRLLGAQDDRANLITMAEQAFDAAMRGRYVAETVYEVPELIGANDELFQLGRVGDTPMGDLVAGVRRDAAPRPVLPNDPWTGLPQIWGAVPTFVPVRREITDDEPLDLPIRYAYEWGSVNEPAGAAGGGGVAASVVDDVFARLRL